MDKAVAGKASLFAQMRFFLPVWFWRCYADLVLRDLRVGAL